MSLNSAPLREPAVSAPVVAQLSSQPVINGVQSITDTVRDTWKDGVSVNGADFAALDQSDVFGDCSKDRLTNPRAWNPVRVDDRPTLSE